MTKLSASIQSADWKLEKHVPAIEAHMAIALAHQGGMVEINREGALWGASKSCGRIGHAGGMTCQKGRRIKIIRTCESDAGRIGMIRSALHKQSLQRGPCPRGHFERFTRRRNNSAQRPSDRAARPARKRDVGRSARRGRVEE